MKRVVAFPAKLTRPQLVVVHLRQRLLDLLDAALTNAPAIWIEAKPGAGKTTLAASWLDRHGFPCLWYQVDASDADLSTFFQYLVQAAQKLAPHSKETLSYLTPEYLPGIETFARRFFESLYRRMPPDSVFVLDNLQEVGVDSPLYPILRIAMETLPAHVKMVCLSRLSPAPALAKLLANSQLASIDATQLRLTAEEAHAVAGLRGHRIANTITHIHGSTRGWAAGFVLMLETGMHYLEGQHDAQTLFNYFASEVLRNMDPIHQHILRRSALLPKMRAGDAAQLSGHAEAGEILAGLQKRNYFTYRLSAGEVLYEYHPLFRQFLLAKLQESSSESELKALKSQAAALLDASGQIEEAALLWSQAQDWQALTPHILKHAPRLLAEGRMQVAESWLTALPTGILDAQPWLLYWMGNCRLAFDPAQARRYFERAFAVFETVDDLAGQCEVWASIVDTFNFEWKDFGKLDHWVAVMDKLVARNPRLPSPVAEVRVAAGMVNALTFRQLDHPGLPGWAATVEAFILTSTDVSLRMMIGNHLVFYYLWIGDFHKLAGLIDALRLSSGQMEECVPLTRQFWYVMQAISAVFFADWKTCHGAVDEGIRNANTSGVHLLDMILLGQGVYGGLSLGGENAAIAYLQKMTAIGHTQPGGHQAFYYFQAAAVAWKQGNLGKAIDLGQRSLRIAEEIGWKYAAALSLLDLADYFFDSGRYDEANASLALGMAPGGAGFLQFMGCMIGARFAFARGNEQQGYVLLEQAMSRGKRYYFVNIPRWHDGRMAQLLARALECGIEVDYAQWLIRKRNLLPPENMPVPELWPVPIRIRMLGGFSVEKDGRPLEVAPGKGHNRPLALLKTLVALGGRPLAIERIIVQCWPDAEGDAGINLLKINLHRLRKLLGSDSAIEYSKGKIALNPREVWVDAWRFDRLQAEAEGALAVHDETRAVERALLALALYHGPFNEGETEGNRTMQVYRQRLAMRAQHLLKSLVNHYEHVAEWAQLEQLCERGLELDDTDEDLYISLMRAHLARGTTAKARQIFERASKALSHAGRKVSASLTALNTTT